MITRRTAVASFVLAMGCGSFAHAAQPGRILFVHGRAQGGRDPEEMRAEWLSAFEAGLSGAGVSMPTEIDIVQPFYGDKLDELTDAFGVPLASNIKSRGDGSLDDFLLFQEEVANDIRLRAGITDEQLDAEYGDNPRERGPLNWEWVQAILAAIDRNAPGLSQDAIELLLRDVYVYLTSSGVRRVIDDLVAENLDSRPTVIVAHSLGSVVAYNILTLRKDLNVPLFVTLGSPLGIRAIRRRFRPLKYPSGTAVWLNAYDNRDVVALYPLDSENFDVSPSVENDGGIRNQTRNRHGISGYLDKPDIAARVVTGT